jgi:hypothetical protein
VDARHVTSSSQPDQKSPIGADKILASHLAQNNTKSAEKTGNVPPQQQQLKLVDIPTGSGPNVQPNATPNPKILSWNEAPVIWPDSVHGCTSISRHTDAKRGITVYVMGETHGPGLFLNCDPAPKQFSSQPVEEFFQTVLRAQPEKTIDIFVETDYVGKAFINDPSARQGIDPSFGKRGSLSAVTMKWLDCLIGLKNVDEPRALCRAMAPNLRMHYVDVRRFPESNLYSKRARKLSNLAENLRTEELLNDFVRSGECKHFLLDWSILETAADIVRVGVKKSKLDKALSKIEDKAVHMHIAQMVQSGIDTLQAKFTKKTTAWLDAFVRAACDAHSKNQLPGPELRRDAQQIARFITMTPLEVLTLGFFQDAYTLARMFRTYRHVASVPRPTTVRNAIMYAGEGHARVLRKSLTTLGFQQTGIEVAERQHVWRQVHFIPKNDTREVLWQCVRIRAFPVPWF